jgi:F-type H+-transporting ATPase subunit gamma
MEQIQQIQRRLDTAREIHSVVKTMKSLAAVNIRHYEQAVESLSRYAGTVEMGLQIALGKRNLRHEPEDRGESVGCIVCGSVQGMVGRFNDRLVEYAEEVRGKKEFEGASFRVLSLGERITPALEDGGFSVEEEFDLAGFLENITPLLSGVLTRVEEWRLKKRVSPVLLFYNRPEGRSSYHPSVAQLMPLDREWLERIQARDWESRKVPMYTMDHEELFSSLIREYLFIMLFRALVESLAAENASRLASMQAAESNIEEHMDELTNRYNRTRQEAITSEILDIVSGYETLRGDS